MDYSKFKGKPFQVISKLGVRYSGVYQDIDQESQTICLSDVYNHGTEDRPVARAIPGSSVSLGWVRFHTNSIESLALIDNYLPPQNDDGLVDPILASVSRGGPQEQRSAGALSGNGLPPRPQQSHSAASADAAMNRVQKSLSDLNVDGNRRRKPQHHAVPPAVPDAEFDFAKGNERFQKERQAMKAAATDKDEEPEEEAVDLGEPEHAPHPSVVAQQEEEEEAPKQERKTTSYNKSSFFDNISSDSSRVSRADERHRNLDTFGEAGGSNQFGGGHGGHRGGHIGNRGRGRGRRGGQGQTREFVHYDLS